jgi:endonuclease III
MAARVGRISPEKRERAARLARLLEENYPGANCALIHANALELLIATILSAQCTDARVNMVTPALFKRYPSAKDFAESDPRELEKLIQSTGFFRSKAKSIREACRDIVEKHGGEVPRTMEELVELRGVGRKTANVVLGNVFGIAGMVVDTHVGRLSRRFGFTRNTDPVKVERDLMALFPPERWTRLSHEMILHGRKFCKAPTPRCDGCPLLEECPYPDKNLRAEKPFAAGKNNGGKKVSNKKMK